MIKPLSKLVEPGWAHALADMESTIHHIGDFLRAENTVGCPWSSASHNILRMFTTLFDSTRMLIVGQDPYPTLGHPVGLSLCVAPNVHSLPKSLINIYRELVNDLGMSMPTSGDSTPWTERGVMLLNRCLTVGVGRPNSHQGKGWGEVIEVAIRALNARMNANGKSQLPVTILRGRNVQSLEPLPTNAFIIKSSHPSPLSASRGFFGSKPFSRANQALATMGADPVDWTFWAGQQPL